MARKIILAAVLFIAGILGTGQSVSASPIYMPALGPIRPPIGQIEFCFRQPSACRPHSTTVDRIELTEELWDELVAVNRDVNDTVRPRTDQSMYGRLEVWDYAGRYGDCEDYALLKQRELIERGWPASVLLVTVVRRRNGNGHAVLTVLTDEGDFILDNLSTRVVSWDRTSYRFLMRQSQGSALRWVTVGSGTPPLVGAVAP
jgi:predicted transglutaminase-like cysteine proteinase